MATVSVRSDQETLAVGAIAGTQPVNYATVSTVNLSTAQTGSAVSTNVADRGSYISRAALLKITTTVGGTPTCTYAIEGSPDNTNWYNIPYADSATPTSVSVATFVIAAATTAWKIIQANTPVQYIRITYSANTNVTNTADLWIFD